MAYIGATGLRLRILGDLAFLRYYNFQIKGFYFIFVTNDVVRAESKTKQGLNKVFG